MPVPTMIEIADVMAETPYSEETVIDFGVDGSLQFMVVVPEVGACRVPSAALEHFMAGADEYAADKMPEHYSGTLSGPWNIKRERLRILAESWQNLSSDLLTLGNGLDRVSNAPENLTAGHFTIEGAAVAIAAQLGWHEGARQTLMKQLMRAAGDGTLKVKHPHTDLYYVPEVVREWYELVTPANVNAWLDTQDVTYRWNIEEPEPRPNLARAASIQPTVTIHSTKTRRNTLTPVIEAAQKKCSNKKDTAEVWGMLLEMANNKHGPLIRTEEEGIAYLFKDAVKIFTRDALDKRLHPEKRKASNPRR